MSLQMCVARQRGISLQTAKREIAKNNEATYPRSTIVADHSTSGWEFDSFGAPHLLRH
jgi:hypothetical protein